MESTCPGKEERQTLGLLRAVARSQGYGSKCIVLLLELFADIASRLQLVSLSNCFRLGLDVIPYFNRKDESICERAPAVISKLRNLRAKWHSSLLVGYLATSVAPSQYRAIYQIVLHFPEHIPMLYVDSTRDLRLIAFILSSLDLPKQRLHFLPELIDRFPSVTALGDIDAFLQIFNHSSGLETDFRPPNVVFRFQDRVCEVPFERLIRRSSFYSFEWPLEILTLATDDNVLNLTAKFKVLTQIPAQSFQIFNEFISKSYNDLTAACLQNLPRCINAFGEIVPEFRFRQFLKKIVLVRSTSRFHSREILTIVEFLHPQYFELLGGLKKVVLMTTSCLISQNKSLSRQAMETLLAIVDVENVEFCFEVLISQIDCFDPLTFPRVIQGLTAIIERFDMFGLFPLYLRQFYDVAAFWTVNLCVTNIFFDFFSRFDLARLCFDEL
jgi:hypothetical protein